MINNHYYLNKYLNITFILFICLIITIFTSILGQTILGLSIMIILCFYSTLTIRNTIKITLFKKGIANTYLIFMLYSIFISTFIMIFEREDYILDKLLRLIFVLILYFTISNVIYLLDIEQFIYSLRSLICLCGILGIFESILKKEILGIITNDATRSWYILTEKTSEYRIHTLFMHPILYAAILVLGIIILYYFPYKNYQKNLIFKIILFFNLLATKSRSSWIACLLVILLIIIKHFSYKSKTTIQKKKIITIVFLLCSVGILFLIFHQHFFDFGSEIYSRILGGFTGKYQDGSRGVRLAIIEKAFLEFRNNTSFGDFIFGKGSGYALYFISSHPISGWNSAIDNQYISILFDYGLIGLILNLYILFKSFFIFIKSRNNILSMCSLSLVSLYISMFFYECFEFRVFNFIIIFLLFSINIYNNKS